MSENPYAPPSARVEDTAPAEESAVRPREIVLVIQLAIANYIIGLVMFVVFWDYFSRMQSTGSFVMNQVFSLALLFWIYYKIYVGRNWARIVLLVFSAIGIFVSASSMFRDVLAAMPMGLKIEMAVGVVINLVILWLLFVSPGRHWFDRARRAGA